jgi:preprotein translocase subunit SecE
MAANSFLGELFQAGLYKPSQGRVTRQVTCGALWLVMLIAAYNVYGQLYNVPAVWQYLVPVLLAVVGGWASYRLVNYPRFADFLIAVEAEMNKVSWPSWPELVRSSLVVIFVMFALAAVLLAFDALWTFLFRDLLQIIR